MPALKPVDGAEDFHTSPMTWPEASFFHLGQVVYVDFATKRMNTAEIARSRGLDESTAYNALCEYKDALKVSPLLEGGHVNKEASADEGPQPTPHTAAEGGAGSDQKESSEPVKPRHHKRHHSYKLFLDELTRVAALHGITGDEIISPRRDRCVVYARQELMWVMRILHNWTYPQIALRLAKDHTTVMFGVREHAKRMDVNDLD